MFNCPEDFNLESATFFARILVLYFSYIFCINSINGVVIPFLTKQGLIAEWGTVSNALEMSTIV